ncbi:uncharacterized protein LOC124591436 [Schistocerca americana]|uniref:uncharacterized protein LOC124591436 n=1 Tax=Schistocerca americana TaxID=7009 RepID=UPI001F4FE955|nr:uncharacterized protein LOC124591436 [Schistocerca americana]
MYGNSDKPVDFSKKPRVVPRKIKNNVYKGLTYRELGYNLGRANPDFEAVAEDKLVTKNYLEMRCELPAQTRSTFLMVFSPDGKKVASTHGNHNVYVTDLTTGKNINTLSGHPRTPWCIAFHPSSNQILATGCLGGQVRVWDLHGGSEVWKAEGQTVIASLAFHPTNRMLVIATYNELHFWDWSQSAPFAKCYTKNEREKLRYVAFDPLGHKLITGISNVPPHSTQWDRSAGSHHLSHHHHLYHHQPFHRTAARHHALYCTHHQQSTNVPGERSEEQLERDGRFNDGISYLSSPREGRTQNGTWEVTSSSTSATSPPPDYERRISVCYRSLAQRYEQLLQRYFDLVRPRFVVTTDRGTDPMEAEETSGSINNAATSNSTNRCTCNNTATSTDNNWTVRNSSSSTTATTSKTKARKSTRGFSSAVDSSSNSSASNVNGARAVNSQARSNSCPCFHEGSTGNVSMCCRICPSSSSSSLGKCSHTPAAVGSSGVRSTLTLDASNSTNCANVQSDDRQALPNVLCPRPIGIVCNEGFSRKPEGQTSQSANSLSVNFSSRETSDTSHMPNENRLSSTTMTRPPESVVTVTTYNRTETEQAEHAAIIDPASTRTVPDMEDQNDFDEQETSGVVNIDQETTLLPSTQTGSSPTCTLTSQIYEQHSPNDDVSSTRRKLTGQPPPQAQAECTISNNHQRQLAGAEQELTSHQDDDQQQQQLPSEPPSQSTSHVGATSAMYRDVRRLRYGIYCLNQQIDSIQRLCRARMEILQLQQIRRVWGNLQRQMNSLHGAVHQTPQSDSPGLVITEEDEPYQPAREPNVSQLQEPIVSQLLELARISDGEPADESSELHASSSSSDSENDEATECVQFVTEEAAPVEICQDRTDDGEIAAKRVKIDPQSSSTKTQWEHVADGDSAGSNVQNTAAELATGSADSPINEKGHRHGTIAKSGRNNMEVNSCSSSRLAMTEETSEVNAVELHSRHNGSVPEVTNEFAVSKSNIPSETFQETGTKEIGSHVTRQERHSIQEQSTQMKGEKLVEHNLPVAGLMTAGCSSASCSTSQNSDYTAAPSQTSRGLKVSPVHSSGRGKTGRNIDDITPRNTLSHQERINEMQNMVKGLQERINQRRIAEQQEITLPERKPTSLWKSCPSHMAKVASTRVSRNCGSHHPNTTPLHPSLPRLQPTTLHLGTHVAQPQPIYTTVRPQEVVASSHSRPTNLVPHGSISCKSFEQTHNEMRTSDSDNVQGEEVSRVTKNESSSTETTDKQECGRKLDDPKNISCVLRTRCKVNSQESLNHVQLTSVTQRTNEERGENSASSQCNNSTEQEIPIQELWGETKHIQNLVRSSNVTAGVSNNGSNETASENETISHSDLIVPSQEELPCATTVINVTNKQNVNCLHPGMNRTHNVQNNFVDANPCSPAGNPADLLSETAAYPANIHPFIPGVVTNFCGNLGESSSDRPDAQQNTHQNSAPEDLSSPERRAVSVGDHSAQVNPSCQQNDDNDDDDGGDDAHGMESTPSSLHFGNSSVQGASTRATVSRSSWRSGAVVSQSESSPNAVRCHIAQRPNPSIIPRQGPLMCPQPDTLLSPRPGPLLTPRASPLLIPGSVQASLRCPRMLHVGGRYYVPRPRFHHRTGHCSRGRIFSRPVTPAEQLRRPWFLQTLTQTYRSSTGRSGEEPGGRCNEFVRQIGAAPRNPVSRPTRSCTNHMQQRGSHGSSNQCGENGESCLRWKHSVESSNDNSERNYNEQHVESILPASPNNHRETVFESRVETAVNMTKGQTLSCDSETSEQSGESSSSKPSVSVTSEEFVPLNSMACTELPEAEVQQPVLPSSLDSGETSTDIKNVCAGGKTVSQAVSEIPHSSLSPVSGSNDSAPFCTHLDTPAMKKGVSHSVSQNVRCRADQSATVRESIPSSSSHSQSTIIENSNSSQCTVLHKGGITENVSQKSVEASLSENYGERTKNVTASQLQESVGRSTATQTPGPPLGQPDPVGPSIASDPPALQNGVCQQFPRYGTGQTVRDIFGRLQRLLDHERMYRQSFMEPRNRTNPQSTRRSGGGFNTTPAHSNTAADVWGRWTRRHSDILPERNAEDEGIPYTGQAASVAAERLISALQTELCETERLYQRIVHLPRTAASRDQVPAAPSRETTRQRARQVLCVMVESLTQVFEENDTFHNFSRDDCDSRVRVFLSDIYFLLQLSVELVDLLLVQIARPWGNVGTQLESRVESTSNSSHNVRDQISHSRPRGTGSFRFYARRGSGAQRPSDGYSRQTPAGASGTVHPNPARPLSRHRTGRSLGRGPWVNRFSGAPTRFLPGMMQCTASADADPPQASIVSPVMHGDSERNGAISRSSRLPASPRGVRGRSQRGSSTSHDGHHQRHSHLFHNFHNYCRQPEEEEQNQQQHPHPEQNLHYHNQQQHQNQQDVDEEEEQQQQQQQQQQQEEQQPQQLSLGSWQQQGQSHQQQHEHLEQQSPQRGGHVQERNSDYHSEHSQDQRGNNNRERVTSGSQVLNSSHENREQAQRNSDMFAVPAVQLNDVPIADVGQLSQIEPPHIRPQSPPANPFGVVSRQSQQMLGGLPPSERWLVNFDEVYPNPGLANSNSMAERRLYPPLPFMGYGQGPQSEPSSRPFSSSSPGSNRGPIHNSPPVNDGHIQRPQSDSGSWTYGAPTGWRSRFLHPRYVGPNMFNEEAFSSVENFSFIRGPDTVIITDAPMSPNHRIQAWDISKFHIPDISNAEKNVIVSECKIHNDASVDVSKDGALLVTLLPSNRMCITAMLGVYSLEWESLGQCLYTTSFEQNAVSVSLSPACRHLLVGLASRRIVLPTDRPTVAQIFRMEDAKPGRSIGGRGRLCHLRDIEQNRENSFTSLNCIRWAPEPGQGLVYGTNTGTLKVLR